jgi:hypothetical protein
MSWRDLAGFGAILCGSIALIGGCAHSPSAKPEKPRIVVIRGNVTKPAHCECTDAERRARAWKAYAEKLEVQLGIPPASASSSP